eukprot:Rhum_TRINITY_DN21258_c0_g1::Rhum_TRINITY_DN21258_c0_g1_i1::g.173593::m.173593
MGKTRMTAVDLRAAVSELSNRLVGQRLVNIYDINSKTYLLKFSGRDADQKDFVVIEVGSRIHSTTFQFDKPKVPSGFTLKIRKHIRQWRLTSLRQLGVDRVVEFTFGSADQACFRLIIEFYAKGNLILSDASYQILALVRTHATEDARYAVRATYPTNDVQLFRPMTLERMEEVFQQVQASEGTMSLKTGFANATEYGPSFVEHCLLKAGLRPNFKKAAAADLGRAAADELLAAFAEPDLFLKDVPEEKGLLIRRLRPGEEGAGRANADLYEDFAPVLYKQHESEGLQAEKFASFNDACDYYFSALDQGQIETHNIKSEKQMMSKLDKAMANHRKRLDGLQKEQASNELYAQLIVENAEEVEAVLVMLRSAIGQAIDWGELSRVVKEQKNLGNPIAAIIHELKLDKNKVSLLLASQSDDADDSAECHVVDVDISMSAHANSRTFFQIKKKIHEKEVKTQAAEGKAMKSAARKAATEGKKEKFVPKKDLKNVRKVLWFEKFDWFITSENYLVVSGRDAQQNEILVKRYLKKGDIYVHADMHGAATTIIKNTSGEGVPSDSLYQAGNMAVCRSNAWTGGIVISAWWVYHNQVSKTAMTGEYLPAGSFMIRGKKNFLPPTKLQMGAGILFRVHEENVAAHKGERRVEDELDDGAGSDSEAPPSSVAPSICAASEAPSSIRCTKQLIDRYGLSGTVWTEGGRTAAAPELEAEVAATKKSNADKVRLSEKERQELKKAKAETRKEDVRAEEEEEQAGDDASDDEGTEAPSVQPSEESAAAGKKEKPTKQKEKTRAEKRKAKKMAKYKDQDEEDKELRMRLCGWDGGLAALDKVEEAEAVEEQKPAREFDQDDAFKVDGKTPSRQWTEEEKKAAEAAQLEKAEMAMDIEVIDHLTGQPFEDDLILHPMLMVGPIEAVERFKFKVSVMPGKDKKGQAAQHLLSHLSQSIVATEQERDHIKRMDVTECINILPSNLRILTDAAVAAGNTKARGGKPAKGGRKRGGK